MFFEKKKKRNFEKNENFWIEPKLKFRYVVGAERKQLAKSLSLTETQVNYVIWSGYKMYQKIFVVANNKLANVANIS